VDDDITRLRMALGRISRLVDRQVRSDGMTRTQLSVLGTMARDRELRMSELAEIEGLNPTMLSRVVGKLADMGYLNRAPGTEDKRAVVVSISATGLRLQNRLRAERSALFTAALTGLDAEESAALLAAVPALESLATALRPMAEAQR
jgi:DNA-binding MarR family transcriptional regulator